MRTGRVLGRTTSESPPRSQFPLWATPGQDIPAGIAVYLVALPLCLGMALACGVPPIAGLIAGAVGGLIVPWISGSPLSVSGPAAGLTAIVITGVRDIGGLSNFLTCVVLAGGIQFCFGLFRLGSATSIVPSSVVKGMLAAIGLVIIVTELPAAFGVTALGAIVTDAHPGAILISGVSVLILMIWKHLAPKQMSWLSGALIVVVAATLLNESWRGSQPRFALDGKLLVEVPMGGVKTILSSLTTPSLSALFRPEVWALAATLAIVASIESLLCLEAIDLLDPLKRKSRANQELLAQGIGNFASGMLGGLPITAVIVRGSANVAAGGRNGLSAVVHGGLLVGTLFFLPGLVNRVPIACLSVVLMDVGLKLCHPRVIKQQLALGHAQVVPFVATALAVFMTNLLKGVMLGVLVGIAFVLRENMRGALEVRQEGDRVHIRFMRDGTFLTRPALSAALGRVRDRAHVIVDANNRYIDFDIKQVLAKFATEASGHGRAIRVELVGVDVTASPVMSSAHG